MQPYKQPETGGSNTDNNEIKQIANIGKIFYNYIYENFIGLGGNMNAI